MGIDVSGQFLHLTEVTETNQTQMAAVKLLPPDNNLALPNMGRSARCSIVWTEKMRHEGGRGRGDFFAS